MNFEIKQQQSCIQFTLRINADLRHKFGIFERSVQLLYAAAVPQTLSPALGRYLVRHTNHPFGLQMRHTKRLTVREITP